MIGMFADFQPWPWSPDKDHTKVFALLEPLPVWMKTLRLATVAPYIEYQNVMLQVKSGGVEKVGDIMVAFWPCCRGKEVSMYI